MDRTPPPNFSVLPPPPTLRAQSTRSRCFQRWISDQKCTRLLSIVEKRCSWPFFPGMTCNVTVHYSALSEVILFVFFRMWLPAVFCLLYSLGLMWVVKNNKTVFCFTFSLNFLFFLCLLDLFILPVPFCRHSLSSCPALNAANMLDNHASYLPLRTLFNFVTSAVFVTSWSLKSPEKFQWLSAKWPNVWIFTRIPSCKTFCGCTFPQKKGWQILTKLGGARSDQFA